MRRTDWQGIIRNGLSRIARHQESHDVETLLSHVASELRRRDSWVSWYEARETVYDEAIACCKRGKRPEWASIEWQVNEWGEDVIARRRDRQMAAEGIVG